MKKATEIFERHWTKATGKPLDEATAHHMKYAIESVHEALNENIITYEALKWWSYLTFEEEFYKIIEWLKSKNSNVTQLHPDDITPEEIEEIYKFHNPNYLDKIIFKK